MASAPVTPGASLSDMLTAVKNLVTALNGAAQNFLNVQGSTNAANISSPTVIKAAAGRVATISILTAGTAVGYIYDATTVSDTSKPIVPLLNYAGVYSAPVAFNFGIVVSPGAGQLVSVGFS